MQDKEKYIENIKEIKSVTDEYKMKVKENISSLSNERKQLIDVMYIYIIIVILKKDNMKRK